MEAMNQWMAPGLTRSNLEVPHVTPCASVLPLNLPEGEQLTQLRESLFVFGLGRQWENPTYTRSAVAALDTQYIPHHVEVWGGDSGHDWPTWRTMLPAALQKLA